MYQQTVERDLAHSPEQLFDIVADVERYPEFVPWWVAAKVKRIDASTYLTDQVIRVSALRQRFTSTTILDRPRAITITSSEKPFKRLEMQWSFDPLSPRGCRVRLSTLFHVKSSVVSKMLGLVSGEAVHTLIESFEERAIALLGEQTPIGLDGVEATGATRLAAA
ncbi:MAG: type II toxin-antitoxin system RatA family toxin [Alphaproteobacteria bacterium]|jgi:coenzyme Q-binding protein COQ10|nr:type II toxin-antitoxin system RatA family toxin [Alphaproteobacteria bacterium]